MSGHGRPGPRNPVHHARKESLEASLDRAFSHLEDGLGEIEDAIAADASRTAALAAFHRLLAVTAVGNTQLPRALHSSALPASAGPPAEPDHPSSPAQLPAVGGTVRGGLSRSAYSGQGFVERLESIAARLHNLVATIAARIGARSYDIGLSIPAGISVSVSFDLPKPKEPPTA